MANLSTIVKALDAQRSELETIRDAAQEKLDELENPDTQKGEKLTAKVDNLTEAIDSLESTISSIESAQADS